MIVPGSVHWNLAKKFNWVTWWLSTAHIPKTGGFQKNRSYDKVYTKIPIHIVTVGRDLMKAYVLCPGICVLILIVSITVTGCMSNEKEPATPLTITSPTIPGGYSANTTSCLIPTLYPNNTQEKTAMRYGFSLTSGSPDYQIPYGSIISHSPDETTRVFDPEGIQILIVNDSDSQSPTPNGYRPATRILETPSGSVIRHEGNLTQIYLNGSCIATIIDATAASTPPNQTDHL
jgi:hypothetical protein